MKFLLLLFATISLVFASNDTAARTTPRPDIVLYLSDDHSRDDCGPYSNKVVRTPNIDALAKESLIFTHAFAASPSCTPSRASLLTGLYPMRNGAHANHSNVNAGIKTWPKYFKEIGYRVAIAGKTDFRPRELFPFEFIQADVDPKAHPLEKVLDTKAVDRFLEDHARNHKEPLCLIVADYNPHVVWAENDGYDPAKIPLPPYLVDTDETRRAATRYYTDISLMDKALGECLASMEKHGFGDALFIHTSDQGGQWPHAKWNLYDAGLNVPFFVHWPGKVKPGTTDAMVSLIDILPTFLEAAGGKPLSDVDGKSFLALLLGKKRNPREAVFAAHTADGDMNNFPSRCIRTKTHKYILNLEPQRKFTTHITDGIARDGRLYWDTWVEKAKTNAEARALVENYQHRSAEELYDLRKDPNELHNIAGDPKNRELLKSLRKQLVEWMKQQGEAEPAILNN